MKRKMITAVTAVLLGGALLTGCGSSDTYSKSESINTAAAAYDSYEYATDDVYFEEAAGSAVTAEGSVDTPRVQDRSRKLIRNVNMDVETEEFEALVQTLTQKVSFYNGYIESSDAYNGSNYSGKQVRNASMRIRIPAENLDAFLNTLAENSNVVRKTESVEDVTLKYVDMASHKNALETEQKRLLELMGQAETMEDILTVESRLSDLRYQIESMESQLRTMDNQVTYSTVYLEITEVTKLTPVEEPTDWERLTHGFVESVFSVGRGIKNFVIGFIIALPYLVVWGVVISIIVLVIRLISKRRRTKKNARKAEAQKEGAVNGRPGNDSPV